MGAFADAVPSLDEETLILIDEGGLDHTRVDALVEALADPELIGRMIPAERGMVLCRFRGSYKEFFKGSDLAAAALPMPSTTKRPGKSCF